MWLSRDLRFVYLHVPRTGGSSTRCALGASPLRGPTHSSARLLRPDETRRYLVVSGVRDPWSWYASLYALAEGRGATAWLRLWGNGSTAFPDVLHGWTTPKSVARWPRPFGGYWSPGHLEAFAGAGVGLWTWAHRWAWAGRVEVLLATSRLDEGLAALGRPAVTLNQSKRRPEIAPELVDLVRGSDGPLLDVFGFEPGSPAPAPLYRRQGDGWAV